MGLQCTRGELVKLKRFNDSPPFRRSKSKRNTGFLNTACTAGQDSFRTLDDEAPTGFPAAASCQPVVPQQQTTHTDPCNTRDPTPLTCCRLEAVVCSGGPPFSCPTEPAVSGRACRRTSLPAVARRVEAVPKAACGGNQSISVATCRSCLGHALVSRHALSQRFQWHIKALTAMPKLLRGASRDPEAPSFLGAGQAPRREACTRYVLHTSSRRGVSQAQPERPASSALAVDKASRPTNRGTASIAMAVTYMTPKQAAKGSSPARTAPRKLGILELPSVKGW